MDRQLIVNAKTVHEVSLSRLMDIARLTDTLPRRRALVGIEPEFVGWGDRLTPAVEEAIAPAPSRGSSRSWSTGAPESGARRRAGRHTPVLMMASLDICKIWIYRFRSQNGYARKPNPNSKRGYADMRPTTIRPLSLFALPAVMIGGVLTGPVFAASACNGLEETICVNAEA